MTFAYIRTFARIAWLAWAPCAAAQEANGVNAPAQRGKPYVVLVSFDGMRAEYLDRLDLPNFARVMRRGVRSEGMIPSFPSKTFPNHYTLVTGLYPAHHGIVANSFWDPTRNARYALSDTSAVRNAEWYGGEPIWRTAEKQGMVAASMFWPGAEAPIGGRTQTLFKPYDGRVSNARRVDTVLGWLGLPAERRPHIVTLYFSDVDHEGHDHGPLSPQVDSAAARVDRALRRLLDGLERLSIRDNVHLILVADHGMSETSPRWFAALDTLIDMQGVRMMDAGPAVSLHVEGGRARALVLRDSINRRMRHGRAYVNGELPAHLHYDGGPRIGDVVVIMDDHFTVGRASRPPREGTATHGWDPLASPMMRAIFVTTGPGVPAGRRIPAFENVEVYPYMAALLGLQPAPGIDGHPGMLAGLIRAAQ